MSRRSARALTAAAAALAALALAACSGAPKKSAPSQARVVSPPAQPSPGGAGRKVSPYAPAQEDLSKRGDYVAGGLYAPGVKDTTPDYIPNVDAIPEPEVTDEPRSRYGNRSPYTVLGKSYHVLDRVDGYVEEGLASYYGNKFHGRRTSNQEVYDMYAFTAAHKSLPLPSFARVTNLDNGKTVVVRVNDRGPFHPGRVIDLSYAAAVKLGIHPRGTGRVEVRALRPGDATLLATAAPPASAAASAAALPPGVRIATGKPTPLMRAAPASPSPPTPAVSAIDSLIEALPIAAARAGERAPDAVAAPSQSAPPAAGSGHEWRFDMRQDGRAMTADEFDSWMKARRARIATGKAGAPDPYGSAAPEARAARAVAAQQERRPRAAAAPPTPARETVAAVREADAAPPPAVAAPPSAAAVTLQVAAFGARSNAERALAMLQRAGIGGAQLLDATADGKPIWRLRVGPVDRQGVAELSARVAGLGFGTPQLVRE